MSRGRFTALMAVILAAAIILKPPQEKTVYVAENRTVCTQCAEEIIPQENENGLDGETAAVTAIIVIIIIVLLFGGSETESS